MAWLLSTATANRQGQPGVASGQGTAHRDHREVDLLVCEDRTLGILELAWHQPQSYEKNKDARGARPCRLKRP